MSTALAKSQPPQSGDRRDFFCLATGAAAAIGGMAMAWPLIDSLNPSADVLSQGSVEIDLSSLEPGQRLTVKWRGKPVFIDYRRTETIAAARSTPLSDLKDPQSDDVRVQKPEWLIVVGICTHLGCVPLGQTTASQRGKWGGWFCPCHGSHYDQSGRIRRGPAPKNLSVPPYRFVTDTQVKIG